jgi:hypothetical protein
MVLAFTLLVLTVHSVISQGPIVANDVANKVGGEKDIPMALYNKAHSYFRASRAFKSFTFQDTVKFIDDLSAWEAPSELKKKFPYYLSGYDHEDRPVWIGEVGKYNVREQVERGEEAIQNLTKYLFQGGLRKMESLIVKDTPTREIRQVFVISDWEGFDNTQSTHLPTVNYVAHILLMYNDFIRLGLGHALVIKQSYLTANGWESVKHLFGEGVIDKIEFVGEQENLEMVLRKRLPQSAIPTWYGGSKDYKPLAVYG